MLKKKIGCQFVTKIVCSVTIAVADTLFAADFVCLVWVIIIILIQLIVVNVRYFLSF